MFKIKFKYWLIILIIILIIAIFLSGCAGECKKDADCAAGKCFSVGCVDKKCVETAITNCCGNGVKEDIETGKVGDKCTCPEDYGGCTGRPKIKTAAREKDAEYLQYLCVDEKCTLAVDESDIKETKLIDEKEFSFFTLETTVTFNQPFNIGKDSFKFRITLKDEKENLVYPIKINSVKLLSGETLFGEIFLTEQFNKVGDITETEFSVIYQPEELEEEKYLSFKLDYEFTKKVKKMVEGNYTYVNEIVRDSYENRFSSKIFFVNPS